MGAPTKLISYQDSLTMPENRLEEIVHGESRIMPPANQKHVDLIEALSDILKAQLDPRQYRVTSTGAGLGIERDPLTYRIPDLMVFRQEARRHDRAKNGGIDPYIWTIPDLIVECLSPSNRKGSLGDLLADYERIAAPEVWLLDPEPRRYSSYRYEAGALREWQSTDRGAVTPHLPPNITVNLEDLWAAFHGDAARC
jgi:Uma2 family endonuclease